MRGQANLLALAVAVVLLVSVTVLGVVVADGALAADIRDPAERRVAVALSERLLAATTGDRGVVDSARLRNLSAADVEPLVPTVDGREVRVEVRVENRTILDETGVREGTTVQRRALVAERGGEVTSRRVRLERERRATVPADVERVDLRIRPANNTTVTTVRANGRVALHDPDGLRGEMSTAVDRLGPTTLRFETRGNATGQVRIRHRRLRMRVATLEVTANV